MIAIKEKVTATIAIEASKEKVWKVLLSDKTYRIWTALFHPGSYFEGNWNEGSTIYFKTPEGDGMISEVLSHKPNEVIKLKNKGVLIKGKQDFDSEESKKWQGMEVYRLTPGNDHIKLEIEADTPSQYAEWFQSTWEKALLKIKSLSE